MRCDGTWSVTGTLGKNNRTLVPTSISESRRISPPARRTFIAAKVRPIPSDPCTVGISRVRAVEVVASLLNNAVLAVEAVKARRPRITLRLSRDDEMVVVEVTDNGVGMTPDVRRQALNPFFTTRRPGALGMGLTFAAMNVRRAGGEILLDSEVDVGTSVRLFFPSVPVTLQVPSYLKN